MPVGVVRDRHHRAWASSLNRDINEVKVNGPLYRQIVEGKDLIADILPPPEYIIESYLTAYELAEQTDAGSDCPARPENASR